MSLLYIFENLFNVWLNGRQLYFKICFCFQSLVIFCLGWRLWWKSHLTQSVLGKERSISITVLDNCSGSFFFFLTIQKQISCRVEPDFISVSFSYSIILKSMHFEYMFYPFMVLKYHILITWIILIHWVIQIFQILIHYIQQYFKNLTSINISTDLTRKNLKYWELVR